MNLNKKLIIIAAAVIVLLGVTAVTVIVKSGKAQPTTAPLETAALSSQNLTSEIQTESSDGGQSGGESSGGESSGEVQSSTDSFDAEQPDDDYSADEQTKTPETYPAADDSFVKIPEEPIAEIPIVNYSVAHSLERVCNEINTLKITYPNLITSSNVGETTLGLDIPLVTLGNGAREVLVAAGIHAREHITVTFLMRCLEEYAAAAAKNESYGGYDIAALLNEYTIYIVPCINPDGMEIAGGRAAALTAVSDLAQFRGNANGVDLNRNFPFIWEEFEGDDLHYKGSSSGGEAETRAMMALCQKHSFEWMLSLHISGNCIYWQDETNGIIPGDRKLADALSEKCGFDIMPCSTDKSGYGGGFENWFRSEYCRPGLCVELISPYVTTTPLGNGNHSDFETVVKWSKTKYVIAAALAG